MSQSIFIPARVLDRDRPSRWLFFICYDLSYKLPSLLFHPRVLSFIYLLTHLFICSCFLLQFSNDVEEFNALKFFTSSRGFSQIFSLANLLLKHFGLRFLSDLWNGVLEKEKANFCYGFKQHKGGWALGISHSCVLSQLEYSWICDSSACAVFRPQN